nr:MAG TPA: hypothetical protein [Caudoviricetes sp.]
MGQIWSSYIEDIQICPRLSMSLIWSISPYPHSYYFVVDIFIYFVYIYFVRNVHFSTKNVDK